MEVYQAYMPYYEGNGMAFYQQTADEQKENQIKAEKLLSNIEGLDKKISETALPEAETASFRKFLEAMKDDVYRLRKENDAILSTTSFYGSVLLHYEAVAAYYGWLSQYKKGIDAATTNDELGELIAKIAQDMADIESSCLHPVQKEYEGLEQAEQRIVQIGRELEALETSFSVLWDEVDGLITGIDGLGTVDADGEVTVYTTNGTARVVKRSDVKRLPKGVYIIDGKKVMVK